VRYRTTKYPELVLANDILLDDAIARCCARHASVRDALGEWEHVDVVGSTFSCPDVGSSDGSQLLGKGRELVLLCVLILGWMLLWRGLLRPFNPLGGLWTWWSRHLSCCTHMHRRRVGNCCTPLSTHVHAHVCLTMCCASWKVGRG
jgi:hypothetical protein